MKVTQWTSLALAAVVAFASISPAVHAKTVAQQCAAITTCYRGGVESNPCTIADGGCPPCIVFSDDGCYVKVGGVCPFGEDCTDYFSSGSSSDATASSTSEASTTGNNDSSTAASTTGSTGNTTTSSTSGSGDGTSAGTSDSNSGGSDMTVVFGIIGAAIGVIAVGVIFLTLVRRSRAANEDDDMAATPPAFAKNASTNAPASTTSGNINYASYGQAAGNVDATPSSGVMSYYNQQPPQNSTAPSPRVAGRAIPTAPRGAPPQAVGRPSAGVTQQSQGFQAVPMATAIPVTQPPAASAKPQSSPRVRRESFEF